MRFFVNFFLFYLLCSSMEAFLFKGRILPEGDIFAIVGKNLVLKCICDTCNFSSGKVSWTFNRINNYILFHLVNTSMTEIEIELFNLNLTTWGKEDEIKCLHNSDFIDVKTIIIGYSPQELKNIQVIVMDMENLNILWKKPQNHPKIRSHFIVSLDHSIINNSCRVGHEAIGMLIHTNSHYQFITNITSIPQTICITESNQLGNASTLFHINLTEHVYLSSPLDLRVYSSYPHNLILTWIMKCQKVLCDVKQVIHEITYYEKNNSTFTTTISTAEFINNSFHINLTDLKPYTEYNIKVKNRMGSHWSESASLKHQTSPDVPGAAPVVVIGNFYYNTTDKNTTIYWKKLKEYENGPGIRYQLTLPTGDIFETNNTFISRKLYQNTSVMLTAKNSVGLSLISTTILVNKSDIYPVLTIGVLQKEKNTYIFWNNATNDDSYSVFWWNKDYYSRNEIQWKLVYNTTALKINCKSCSDIFVSANQKNSSSGMQKQSCTYNGEDQISLENMFRVNNDSSSITVILLRQSCDYIFFNKINISCNQEYDELEIQRNDRSSVTFKNLKSLATYHLKIVAVPRFDNPNRAYMKEYNFQMPESSFFKYIVTFVIISTLLVLALISFLMYRFKKKITAHFEVNLPEGIQDFEENGIFSFFNAEDDLMISLKVELSSKNYQSQKSTQMPPNFSAEYSKIIIQESDNSNCDRISTSSSEFDNSNCDRISTSSSESVYSTDPHPQIANNYIPVSDMKSRNIISDLEKY